MFSLFFLGISHCLSSFVSSLLGSKSSVFSCFSSIFFFLLLSFVSSSLFSIFLSLSFLLFFFLKVISFFFNLHECLLIQDCFLNSSLNSSSLSGIFCPSMDFSSFEFSFFHLLFHSLSSFSGFISLTFLCFSQFCFHFSLKSFLGIARFDTLSFKHSKSCSSLHHHLSVHPDFISLVRFFISKLSSEFIKFICIFHSFFGSYHVILSFLSLFFLFALLDFLFVVHFIKSNFFSFLINLNTFSFFLSSNFSFLSSSKESCSLFLSSSFGFSSLSDKSLSSFFFLL